MIRIPSYPHLKQSSIAIIWRPAKPLIRILRAHLDSRSLALPITLDFELPDNIPYLPKLGPDNIDNRLQIIMKALNFMKIEKLKFCKILTLPLSTKTLFLNDL